MSHLSVPLILLKFQDLPLIFSMISAAAMTKLDGVLVEWQLVNVDGGRTQGSSFIYIYAVPVTRICSVSAIDTIVQH
ncbi:hypothetical protein K1719_018030 [Acacia pycnantha]|nr:hypothetical protein K1719_018030 [Acacia pycnantha]